MEKKEWISEKDVGILEYLTPGLNAIKGVIKSRYSDFIVNEISKSGHLCYLSKAQTEKKEHTFHSSKATEESKAAKLNIVISEEGKTQLKETMKATNSYEGMIEHIANISEGIIPRDQIYQFPCDAMDKPARTQFHQAIKKYLPQFETFTVEEGSGKYLKIALTDGLSKAKRKKYGMERRDPLPEKPFLHFDVMKTNTDTMAAMYTLAKGTNKPVKAYAFAGTKDKRGITTQRVSVFAISKAEIEAQLLKIPNLHIGNLTEEKEALKLGDLEGNRFCLAIRDLSSDCTLEAIAKNVEEVKKNGFINYFGMQRFGTHSVPTHEIGKFILKKNWSQAVKLILGQYGNNFPGEKEKKTKIVEHVEKGEYKEALELVNYKEKIEKAVLVGMQKGSTNGYFSGIANIPRGSRMLYVHAYQSYVWNKVVSQRIKKYGRKVFVGDILASTIEEIEGDESELESKSLKAVPIKTEEEALKYTLADIAMPVIGSKITVSPTDKSEISMLYIEAMKEDDITPEMFKHHDDILCTYGTYRKIIAVPKIHSYALVNYSDPLGDIVSPFYMDADNKFLPPSGPHKGLIISFSLSTCCYATMLLREVMREGRKLDFVAEEKVEEDEIPDKE